MQDKDERTLFDEAFLPHMAEAYRLARWFTGSASDAEDVVQDAALRAFRAIRGFGAGNARAWSLSIVRNTAYTWLAKNRSKMVVPAEEPSAAELLQIEQEGAYGARAETPLASDASLTARYDNIIALRDALRSLPKHHIPVTLHARVSAALASAREQAAVIDPEAGYPAPRSWSWRAPAASTIVGAVLGGSVMSTIERADLQPDVAREIAAGHIRSLLAPQPFDIASSDRHTVKPWFTARLPESPQVVDLAAQGIRLAGGRVDVIGTFRLRHWFISMPRIPSA